MVNFTVSQPGPYDGGTEKDRIAVLERFVPLERTVKESECPVAAGVQKLINQLIKVIRPSYEMKFFKHSRASNTIDAAVAKPSRADIINNEIFELGPVTGVGELKAGMTVQKSGRSSGLTSGQITALSTSLKVEMGEGEYGWFSDQVVSDCVVNPGDSGSLVLNEEKQAVGLVFAGSDRFSVFNRIDHVLKQLRVTF